MTTPQRSKAPLDDSSTVEDELLGHVWEELILCELEEVPSDQVNDHVCWMEQESHESLSEGSFARTSVPGYHTVQRGESIAQISVHYGFADWSVIWKHANNSDITGRRLPRPPSKRPRLRIPISSPIQIIEITTNSSCPGGVILVQLLEITGSDQQSHSRGPGFEPP